MSTPSRLSLDALCVRTLYFLFLWARLRQRAAVCLNRKCPLFFDKIPGLPAGIFNLGIDRGLSV